MLRKYLRINSWVLLGILFGNILWQGQNREPYFLLFIVLIILAANGGAFYGIYQNRKQAENDKG